MTSRRPLARISLAPLALLALSACSGAPEGAEDAQKSGQDLVLCSPAVCDPANLLPDLTVVEDDRPQTVCTPQAGCYPAYAKGFDVKNIGLGAAGSFRVSVLDGAQSYGFDLPSLAAGASEYFELPTIACGDSVVVLVNPEMTLKETNYSNDAVVIQGYCNL